MNDKKLKKPTAPLDLFHSDVFLVGRYFCDLVYSGLPEFPKLGHEVYSSDCRIIPGGVYTPAVTLQRLGLKIVWPCTFGTDPFSQYVKVQALRNNIPGDWFKDTDLPSLRITTVFSFDDERAFISYVDPMPSYAYSKLIVTTRPRWIYLTYLLVGRELDEIHSAAHSVGTKIYMDCQAHNHGIQEKAVQDALRLVDVFSPNRAESNALCGTDQIAAIMRDLGKFARVVLVKDGMNGCYFCENNETTHVPGIKTDVVDTTGAGDNFNCGYLYGAINGFDAAQSLLLANICGGLSVQGIGGSSQEISENKLKEIFERFSIRRELSD